MFTVILDVNGVKYRYSEMNCCFIQLYPSEYFHLILSPILSLKYIIYKASDAYDDFNSDYSMLSSGPTNLGSFLYTATSSSIDY